MDKIDFLKNVSLFSGIEYNQLLNIANICKEKSYQKNSIVFFEDDPGTAFYIIKSGFVKILKYSEDGRTTILSILGKGEYFGEMAVIDSTSRSATAETLTDCTLFVIHKNDFEKLIRTTPTLALQIIHTLSHRLRQADKQIDHLTFQSAQDRIINTFLRLCEQFGTKDGNRIVVDIELTHQDIAALAGTTRETTSRILGKLKKEGIVNFLKGQIVILNKEKLVKKVSK